MKQVPLRFDWLVWFLSNRKQRRLAVFMGFVDNVYDFWPLECDTLSNPLNLSDLFSLNPDFFDFDIASWNYDGEVMHWFCWHQQTINRQDAAYRDEGLKWSLKQPNGLNRAFSFGFVIPGKYIHINSWIYLFLVDQSLKVSNHKTSP